MFNIKSDCVSLTIMKTMIKIIIIIIIIFVFLSLVHRH